MRKHDWIGLVAIVFTLGISIAIVLLAVETILHSGSNSTEIEIESTTLATVLGAGVGAIATYIGLTRHNDDSENN